MNKISNLKFRGNIEKYIGNGFSLMGAGLIGSDITLKIVSEQPSSVTVPLILAWGCIIEACISYGLSANTEIEITYQKLRQQCEKSKAADNEIINNNIKKLNEELKIKPKILTKIIVPKHL